MHKTVFSSLIAITTVIALSGCSSLFSPIPVAVDIDGDGKISAGEALLASYIATLAGSGPTSVTAAQVASLMGIAAGSNTAISASSSVGTFQAASVKMAADYSTLDVTVDGETHTLAQGHPVVQMTLNGKPVSLYYYGAFFQTGTIPVRYKRGNIER
jgi:hypothetical protein